MDLDLEFGGKLTLRVTFAVAKIMVTGIEELLMKMDMER